MIPMTPCGRAKREITFALMKYCRNLDDIVGKIRRIVGGNFANDMYQRIYIVFSQMDFIVEGVKAIKH